MSYANPEIEIWEITIDGIIFRNASIPTNRLGRIYGDDVAMFAVDADFCQK